jgi:hypothetical protein
MKAYNDAINKLESDPTYAFQAAKKYWGQGTSDATLKEELNFYLNDEWKGTDFPQSLYDASKSVLLNSDSGFKADSFPSYQQMTDGAPAAGQ